MNKIIIGNWKMNGSVALVDSFLNTIKNENIAIALPDIFLAYAKSKKPRFKLAAQDCSIYNDFGAHTGEISAHMLSDIGCKYVIIGHSERRSAFETDSVSNILKKLNNVIANEMIAILCVDEQYQNLIDQDTLDFMKSNSDNIILAYEPISAIGTGVVPTITEISNTLLDIKKKYFNLKVLYGGSVNAKNIKDILDIESLDGVLIGGASLKLEEFKQIEKFA